MPARRNPVCHPLSAAKACRAARVKEPAQHVRGAAVSDDAVKCAVDRGYRRFWLRRGIDVDSNRVHDF